MYTIPNCPAAARKLADRAIAESCQWSGFFPSTADLEEVFGLLHSKTPWRGLEAINTACENRHAADQKIQEVHSWSPLFPGKDLHRVLLLLAENPQEGVKAVEEAKARAAKCGRLRSLGQLPKETRPKWLNEPLEDAVRKSVANRRRLPVAA